MSTGEHVTSAEAGLARPHTAATVPARTSKFRFSEQIVLDIFVMFELALIVLCAVAAKYIYLDFYLESNQQDSKYIFAGFICCALSYYFFNANQLYDKSIMSEGVMRPSRMCMALFFAFLTLIVLAFLAKNSSDYSRGWLIVWFALSCLSLTLTRIVAATWFRWLTERGVFARRIAIIGSGSCAVRLWESLCNVRGVQLIGIYDDEVLSHEYDDQGNSQGSISDLIAHSQLDELDEVIIATASMTRQRLVYLMGALSVLPVDVQLAADPFAFSVALRRVSRLGEVNLLEVGRKPISDWGKFAKRAEDYVLATIGLVVATPLMAIVAIAIKLESAGPVFFRQKRHGYSHTVITVLKFRTMTVMEDGPSLQQATRNDGRVTRVGKFLRRTSLDEQPQIINVLRGKMSLVGPRPHAISHNQYYGAMLERYANRHCVKPGITGWAQIHGYRGPTEDPDKMRKRVELDLYYIDNWSIWLDLRILAATVFVGFINKNAV